MINQVVRTDAAIPTGMKGNNIELAGMRRSLPNAEAMSVSADFDVSTTVTPRF